jgi:DNA primase
MSDWLDFKSIKREANLESVLRHYRVDLRRSGKDQYRGRCPIHRGEGRDAFHANMARNVFHCFACGAGGTVLDFIAAMERCSLYEAAERLKEMTNSSGQSRPTSNEKELVTERRKVSLPLTFALRGIDCTHPYLAERGISKETALTFGVGFYKGPGLMHRRLVIPIHNAAGELIAYCGRSVDQIQPRYRVPPGFAKSEVLFNLHRAAATQEPSVILVEGFFDCMKVHQAGVQAVVALMGAVLYETQRCALLSRFHRLILMLDGDAAGRRATKIIAAKLQPRCPVHVVELPVSAQPDQLSTREIREILPPAIQRRLRFGNILK